VLLALIGGSSLLQSMRREVITPAAPASTVQSAEATRADAAAALLEDLERALSHGSRAEALALASPEAPGARANLGWLHDNVRELGITDLALRYVDERSGAAAAQAQQRLGEDAWVAAVELSWRLEGYDTAVSSMEVPITLVDDGESVGFGASDVFAGAAADTASSVPAGAADTSAPLWLLDDLAVATSRRALVMVAEEDQLGRYARLANRAVRAVRKVLPRWREGLVVEVPAAEEQLHRLLAAEPGSYSTIAAVTAIVDGSQGPGAPVHILVNPDVFGDLGAEGAQIVMSHEAAHVALDAASSTMPLWLLEGFADYVALARSDLPVEVTGSQILQRVRETGPPRDLPDAAAFAPSNQRLGTSYEAAWLACLLLAETYGEDRLIAFYRAVDRGDTVEEAFAELGTSTAAFTREWRRYLRELAS
jgi:hypothetical protein